MDWRLTAQRTRQLRADMEEARIAAELGQRKEYLRSKFVEMLDDALPEGIPYEVVFKEGPVDRNGVPQVEVSAVCDLGDGVQVVVTPSGLREREEMGLSLLEAYERTLKDRAKASEDAEVARLTKEASQMRSDAFTRRDKVMAEYGIHTDETDEQGYRMEVAGSLVAVPEVPMIAYIARQSGVEGVRKTVSDFGRRIEEAFSGIEERAEKVRARQQAKAAEGARYEQTYSALAKEAEGLSMLTENVFIYSHTYPVSAMAADYGDYVTESNTVYSFMDEPDSEGWIHYINGDRVEQMKILNAHGAIVVKVVTFAAGTRAYTLPPALSVNGVLERDGVSYHYTRPSRRLTE